MIKRIKSSKLTDKGGGILKYIQQSHATEHADTTGNRRT